MKTFYQFYQESLYTTEQLTVYGQLRYGSTPGKATNQSVSSAVDRALASPNVAQSASSKIGKTGVTGSGYIQYSGAINKRPPELKPKPEQKKTTTTTTKTPVPPRGGQPPIPPRGGQPPIPPRGGQPPMGVNVAAQQAIQSRQNQIAGTHAAAKAQIDRAIQSRQNQIAGTHAAAKAQIDRANVARTQMQDLAQNNIELARAKQNALQNQNGRQQIMGR